MRSKVHFGNSIPAFGRVRRFDIHRCCPCLPSDLHDDLVCVDGLLEWERWFEWEHE
jgi:hypothetical protein